MDTPGGRPACDVASGQCFLVVANLHPTKSLRRVGIRLRKTLGGVPRLRYPARAWMHLSSNPIGWLGALAIIVGVPIGIIATLGLTIAAAIAANKRKDKVNG